MLLFITVFRVRVPYVVRFRKKNTRFSRVMTYARKRRTINIGVSVSKSINRYRVSVEQGYTMMIDDHARFLGYSAIEKNIY